MKLQRLVEDHPVLHPVAERVGHHADVLLEPADDVAVRPAAAVLERLGQVPVVQRDPRFDAGFEARVDDPGVEVEPGLR